MYPITYDTQYFGYIQFKVIISLEINSIIRTTADLPTSNLKNYKIMTKIHKQSNAIFVKFEEVGQSQV